MTPPFYISLAVLTIVLLSGCGNRATGDSHQVVRLDFRPIGTGSRGTLSDSIQTVIRDSAIWAVYRDSLNPTEPFEEVDFAESIVLLVALPQETSGYAVDFISIERTDTAAVATYLVNVPGYDCLTASALTVPFSAVVVASMDEPVQFKRHFEEYRCTGRRRR